jgi:hypothetical protein
MKATPYDKRGKITGGRSDMRALKQESLLQFELESSQSAFYASGCNTFPAVLPTGLLSTVSFLFRKLCTSESTP